MAPSDVYLYRFGHFELVALFLLILSCFPLNLFQSTTVNNVYFSYGYDPITREQNWDLI